MSTDIETRSDTSKKPYELGDRLARLEDRLKRVPKRQVEKARMTNADVILLVLLGVVFVGFFAVFEQLKEITTVLRHISRGDQGKDG